MQLVCSKNP